MNIGRNEPCPCGSGKKYKKCCLSRVVPDEPSSSQPPAAHRLDSQFAMPQSHAVEADSETPWMNPYSIAKMVEHPDPAFMRDAAFRKRIERCQRDYWTIARIARLSTDQIEGQLRQYGVPYERSDFLARAAKSRSAWRISDPWVKVPSLQCKGKEVDFLGLAACELWKRLIPERPSIEVLDDWMQEGYRLMQEGRQTDTCDIWLKVWNILRPTFLKSMVAMEKAASVFNGMQCLSNWCQDLEMELHNASINDRRYAELGLKYCGEWFAQFRGESDMTWTNFVYTSSNFQFNLGMREQAFATLRAGIRRCPDYPWAYIHLSDALRDHPAPGADRRVELSTANELLEDALVHMGDEPDMVQTIEERRDEIGKELEATRAPRGPARTQ